MEEMNNKNDVGYFKYKKNQLSKISKVILLSSFFIRMFIIFFDAYIKRIPFNNGDAYSYHNTAILISDRLYLLKDKKIYGGMYSKLLGILYHFSGNSRILAESLNAFLGVVSAYLVFNISEKVNFKSKKIKYVIQFFVAFYPFSIIFSVCLLRESIIVFFLVLSLSLCIRYIETQKFYNILLSYLSIVAASVFHSGCLFIIFGYILIYSFYEFNDKKIRFKLKNIIKFLLTMVIITLIIINFSDTFDKKIINKINSYSNVIKVNDNISTNSYEENVNINDSDNSFIKNNPVTRAIEDYRESSSSYIGERKVNNLFDLIIYTIEKVVYFLFSPMPWNFRGSVDVIIFVIDSISYMIIIFSIFNSFRKIDRTRLIIVIFLCFGLGLSITAFSLGTTAAGTALRHRNKFMYFMIMLGLMCNIEEVKKLNE